MASKTDTQAHNIAAIQRMMQAQRAADTAECPECHGPANPTLIAQWGHCVSCHSAQWRAAH